MIAKKAMQGKEQDLCFPLVSSTLNGECQADFRRKKKKKLFHPHYPFSYLLVIIFLSTVSAIPLTGLYEVSSAESYISV